MTASAESAGKSRSQHSQFGRSSSIVNSSQNPLGYHQMLANDTTVPQQAREERSDEAQGKVIFVNRPSQLPLAPGAPGNEDDREVPPIHRFVPDRATAVAASGRLPPSR